MDSGLVPRSFDTRNLAEFANLRGTLVASVVDPVNWRDGARAKPGIQAVVCQSENPAKFDTRNLAELAEPRGIHRHQYKQFGVDPLLWTPH